MRNITEGVSDDCYRQARIWAAKNDTSVSAVVQDLLQNLPGLARVARTFTAGPPAASSFPDPPRNKKQESFSGCEGLEMNRTEVESNT